MNTFWHNQPFNSINDFNLAQNKNELDTPGLKQPSTGTDQGTEEVHSFQYKLLVSYSGDAELFQLLVGDVQQLLSSYLLPLKALHVLLEAVIQT